MLDNFAHGQNSLAAYCSNPYFEIVRGDCRDRFLMNELVKKADIIIPLAALVGAPMCKADATAAISTNLDAVKMLCKLASKSQQIIIPNSNSGYGTSKEECTEESPLNPLSLYAQTKADAEAVVMERENSIAFRLATVFGASPRMRLDLLVNDFVLRAVRDCAIVLFEPYAMRNYIHVRDVAHAFLYAICGFERMKGNIYNAGDTRANCDKAYLCTAIQKHLADFRWHIGDGSDPDRRDYKVSNAKLEATGWHPLYTLDQGIVELIKLYKGLNERRYANA